MGVIALAASNNFFGSINTSTIDGTVVNQNLFDSKDDVYLNGGPQNQNATGLPDGIYYFRVTDPSGATLLSTDNAMCRQLTVANGKVAGATGPCPHPNGNFNPGTGTTPVKLMPFNDTPNNGGEYKVWLIRQTSSTNIDPVHPAIVLFDSKDAKTDNFKIRCVGDCGGTQQSLFTLSGQKFYDANANGINDGEAAIGGFQINILLNGILPVSACTAPNGTWSYSPVFTLDSYTVSEQLPPQTLLTDGYYWKQTSPAPDSNNFQGYSGIVGLADVTGLNFGNICFKPAAGGLTLGYWSNKNGQASLNTCPGGGMTGALAFLGGLNLKKPDGTDFNPTTYAQLHDWLLNGNAVNMAYMLSVQLAATSLDTRCAKLDPTTIVDASSLGLGFITIQSLITAANTELDLLGGNVTFTGNPLRADEEILKDALDAINNNRLPFASKTACKVDYGLASLCPVQP